MSCREELGVETWKDGAPASVQICIQLYNLQMTLLNGAAHAPLGNAAEEPTWIKGSGCVVWYHGIAKKNSDVVYFKTATTQHKTERELGHSRETPVRMGAP